MSRLGKSLTSVSIAIIVVFGFALCTAYIDAVSIKNISKCKISLKYTSDVYTGNSKKPEVTVKYKSKVLKKGVDYTVKYSNNVNPGTAKAIIKGKGKFKGTRTKSFKIYVKPVSSIKLTRPSGNSIQLSWSKAKKSKYYKIKVYANGEPYKNGTYKTKGTSYKFTEVPPDVNYKFIVTSYAGPKNKASAGKSLKYKLDRLSYVGTPKLSGTSKGYRRNDLTWGKVDYASGYNLKEIDPSGNESVVNIGKPDTLEYSFYDKKYNNSYQYEIQAYTYNGGETIASEWSKPIGVTPKKTYMGQACKDYDKKAGDGNGKEVKKSDWTTSSSSTSCYNWTYVFRFKDPEKAKQAAKNMEAGIANNNIGYNSNGTKAYGKNAIQYQAAECGYDLSKIKVKTGCACGDIVALCVIYSGIPMKYEGSGLGVAKQLKGLSSDFTCYSSKEYVRSDAYLQRGDILVTAHPNGKNNHVSMVL